MPTFDFRCTACETTFEAAIPFGSKEFPPCSACGKAVEKLLTPPLGIVFKGQGFYKTDASAPAPTKETSPPADQAPIKTASDSDPPSKKPEKTV